MKKGRESLFHEGLGEGLNLSSLCMLIESALSPLSDSYNVKAEISSLSVRGGHCYMDLVEKSADGGSLAAKVRATCWSNVWTVLSAYFIHETGQPLAAGMQVLVEATVSFHPVYGLSLQILGIDPSYTLGDLARQRQQTITRLQKEGVIDMQQLLAMPTLPKRIAVVSSSEAAGYEDFIHQLGSSGYLFEPVLFPAIMQGDRAAASIVAALNSIYEKKDAYDIVVLIRGGGAVTDLSCFDSYDIAVNIAQFPLPVLTGIGHQRDVSVADMVACRSLKTPTAVAEYLISRMDSAQERLNQLALRLSGTASRCVMLQQERLSRLTLQLQSAFAAILLRERNRLDLAEKTVALLSPADIFRKGYSLTICNGQVVKNAADIHEGDLLVTELYDGKVKSIAQ